MPSQEEYHLWGAIDCYGIGGDELDGPGVNWWIDYPEPLTGSEVYEPLITDSLDLWADVDICIVADSWRTTIPREVSVIVVRED